jgi:hypothetical protein
LSEWKRRERNFRILPVRVNRSKNEEGCLQEGAREREKEIERPAAAMIPNDMFKRLQKVRITGMPPNILLHERLNALK